MAYDFDRLGFLQFEQLWARVLELDAGIAADAWKGEADRDRSVLSAAPLGPPVTKTELPAPVLVQCAWVREGGRQRLLDDVSAFSVNHPDDVATARSFVLLTNLALRQRSAGTVAAILDAAQRPVRVLGPAELGARVDARAEIRLAMPSVLGLRDPDELIDPAIADRSTLDREAARALAPVFVPTGAYGRALEVLAAHRFTVLTGPPEMGKTAIARMIGLAHMTAGWEAHECIRPDDVWRTFDPARQQLFIADDAFGSTEYRPDAAERWAVEMERLLRSLDQRHWLIWTSRPAPLRAGLGRLQRERSAERFPAPGEVLVDASELDPGEKTLILFRHAKAAGLPAKTRAWIRESGPEIVAHPHFTPERIRRFVARLRRSPGTLSGADLELGTVTESMATSFAALTREQRDLLVALLDSPPGPVAERDLISALRRHHDGALAQAPVELVDRLADHFLRVLA